MTDPLPVWKILQKQFEFVSVTQFCAASIKEGADLMQHLTHMTSLAEQLGEMNENISSKKVATVVLGSLRESHDNFLTSLSARSVDDLDREKVKEEYMKRTEKDEKQESDNALFTREKSSYRGRFQPRGGASGGRGGRFQNFDLIKCSGQP